MTRYALVPVEATEDMLDAIREQNIAGWAVDAWNNAVVAAPAQGTVTAAQLDEAAAGLLSDWESDGKGEPFGFDWAMKIIRSDDPELQGTRLEFLRMARAALSALGLQVQP